jgi:hypothetical protein
MLAAPGPEMPSLTTKDLGSCGRMEVVSPQQELTRDLHHAIHRRPRRHARVNRQAAVTEPTHPSPETLILCGMLF